MKASFKSTDELKQMQSSWGTNELWPDQSAKTTAQQREQYVGYVVKRLYYVQLYLTQAPMDAALQ